MKPDEIAAVIASHRIWLAGSGGARADLRVADLRGADLRGADLSGADLRGAKRHDGIAIDRLWLAGEVAGFAALVYSAEGGAVYAEYGCETAPRTIAQWREDLPDLCRRHRPDDAMDYQRILTGLLAIEWTAEVAS